MTAHFEDDGNLRVALATWVYLLFAAGVQPANDALTAACAAVGDASDASAGDAAGMALIEQIAAMVEASGDDQVVPLAQALYGDRVELDLGDSDRESRTHKIRKYQFSRALPWLARIWERREDGQVAPSWVLISRVTDQVQIMDPNPWNDIDEDRAIPLSDFHVLWELDGCPSVRVR